MFFTAGHISVNCCVIVDFVEFYERGHDNNLKDYDT